MFNTTVFVFSVRVYSLELDAKKEENAINFPLSTRERIMVEIKLSGNQNVYSIEYISKAT